MAKLRDVLTFQTTSEAPSKEDDPRGKWIAQLLYDKLPALGVRMNWMSQMGSNAYDVDCVIDDIKATFFVGDHEMLDSDWQLVVGTRLGILSRLFGRDDNSVVPKLARLIHDVLSADSRFVNLRWHEKYRAGRRNEGHPTPD